MAQKKFTGNDLMICQSLAPFSLSRAFVQSRRGHGLIEVNTMLRVRDCFVSQGKMSESASGLLIGYLQFESLK